MTECVAPIPEQKEQSRGRGLHWGEREDCVKIISVQYFGVTRTSEMLQKGRDK